MAAPAPTANLNLSASLKQFSLERQQRRAALDEKVETCLGIVAEVDTNIRACLGKELLHAAANQRHLELAVRELQHNATALSKHFGQHATQVEAFQQNVKDVGSLADWLKTMEGGLNDTLSLLVVIEKRLTQTEG
jgi:seryl-tRNA synthetase